METPRDRVVRVLKAALPGLEDILTDMTSVGGWLNFPEKFTQLCLIANLQWWTFYEDERKLRALTPLMFLSKEEALAMYEAGKANEFVDDLIEISSAIDLLEMPTDDELSAYAKEFNNGTKEDRQEILKRIVLLALGTLTGTSNYFSLMIHGRTLCQLVADAKGGDDEAFCRAVQIDRTVLSLPYFRERMISAQLGMEPDFLSALAYRLKTPILSSRIKLPKLWLTFAILDDEGLLSLPHEEILDICHEVGVYGAEEVGHLSKRLAEYRRAQRM